MQRYSSMPPSLDQVADRIRAYLFEHHIELLRDGEPIMGEDETQTCLRLADAALKVVDEKPVQPRARMRDKVTLTPQLLGLLKKVSGA